MKGSTSAVEILPAAPISVEIVDGWRIGIALVKGLDRFADVRAGSHLWLPAVVCLRCHHERLRYLPDVVAAVSLSST